MSNRFKRRKLRAITTVVIGIHWTMGHDQGAIFVSPEGGNEEFGLTQTEDTPLIATFEDSDAAQSLIRTLLSISPQGMLMEEADITIDSAQRQLIARLVEGA